MIPLIADVKYRHSPRGRTYRIWLPLFLIWLLLAPIALLILPFFFLGCLVTWINPFQALGIFAGILSSVRGTKIEVEVPEHYIWVDIR